MELYQLEYFVEVARQQSFTRAAARLRIAQPALTQQVQRLEKEFDVVLLERGRARTLMTAAGQLLFDKGCKLLAEADALKQALAELGKMKRGMLRLGTIPSAGLSWLPSVLEIFVRKYPDVELKIAEDSSEGVAALVNSGVCELGIVQFPADETLFTATPLFTEKFCVLLPRKHRLASLTSVTWHQLAEEPLVLFKGKVREVVLAACRGQGWEPRVSCESAALGTIKALVATGLGVAILPELAVRSRERGIVVVNLRGPVIRRELGLIVRKKGSLSRAAIAFVEVAAAFHPSRSD